MSLALLWLTITCQRMKSGWGVGKSENEILLTSLWDFKADAQKKGAFDAILSNICQTQSGFVPGTVQ
ncbi:MAG: hypothetical protein P8Q92_14645 [Pseudoprimorskyibacter sp.]|nr:hypothetical protein [Pseudoprimorskyibacter sp.]